MRLNLGCGRNHDPGSVNVDRISPADVICDLEAFPWPWDDNSVDEVLAFSVLEHLGASTEIFLGIMRELYRVCKPDAKIHITVPHPAHDDFYNDPTHVRAITGYGMALFSQRLNRKSREGKYPNSPLGEQIGVDFEVEKCTFMLDSWVMAKGLEGDALDEFVNSHRNTVKEIHLEVRVVK